VEKVAELNVEGQPGARKSRWLILGVAVAAAATGGCIPGGYAPCSSCAPNPSIITGDPNSPYTSSSSWGI
jgi:hypothetical protein